MQKEAFRLSEEYHTPVLLRMCTRISHSQSIVERGVRQEVPAREYVKDPLRVMMTTNSLKAHYRVEARTKAMTELAETSPLKPSGNGGGYLFGHHYFFYQLSVCSGGLW